MFDNYFLFFRLDIDIINFYRCAQNCFIINKYCRTFNFYTCIFWYSRTKEPKKRTAIAANIAEMDDDSWSTPVKKRKRTYKTSTKTTVQDESMITRSPRKRGRPRKRKNQNKQETENTE